MRGVKTLVSAIRHGIKVVVQENLAADVALRGTAPQLNIPKPVGDLVDLLRRDEEDAAQNSRAYSGHSNNKGVTEVHQLENLRPVFSKGCRTINSATERQWEWILPGRYKTQIVPSEVGSTDNTRRVVTGRDYILATERNQERKRICGLRSNCDDTGQQQRYSKYFFSCAHD
jgi:hypothetical protein